MIYCVLVGFVVISIMFYWVMIMMSDLYKRQCLLEDVLKAYFEETLKLCMKPRGTKEVEK